MTVVAQGARDLVDRGDRVFESLRVPEGWEPIARVCARVDHRLPDLSGSIADLIRSEIPAYREASVPRSDVASSVFHNIEMMLVGIAENRGPQVGELEIRRELGRRRAHQGLPADALIQAYHVGYRELWGALVSAAEAEGSTTRELLLSAVTTVWGWIQDVTEAIAQTHHEVTRGLELRSAVMRQRFLDLLISGETDTDEFSDLGHAIGFNPDGRFRAAFVTMNADAESEEALRAALASLERAVVSFRASDAIVVLQAQDVSELIATVRQVHTRASIGIGLERAGYPGARLSIGDAERAVAVAAEGAITWFETGWLEASLAPGFARLQDLMRPGLTTAASHPELAATVAIYAECGFSLADSARKVGVHANTVTYRLDRWQDLTGWDARTFEGLSKSIASIRLQPRGGR